RGDDGLYDFREYRERRVGTGAPRPRARRAGRRDRARAPAPAPAGRLALVPAPSRPAGVFGHPRSGASTVVSAGRLDIAIKGCLAGFAATVACLLIFFLGTRASPFRGSWWRLRAFRSGTSSTIFSC